MNKLHAIPAGTDFSDCPRSERANGGATLPCAGTEIARTRQRQRRRTARFAVAEVANHGLGHAEYCRSVEESLVIPATAGGGPGRNTSCSDPRSSGGRRKFPVACWWCGRRGCCRKRPRQQRWTMASSFAALPGADGNCLDASGGSRRPVLRRRLAVTGWRLAGRAARLCLSSALKSFI